MPALRAPFTFTVAGQEYIQNAYKRRASPRPKARNRDGLLTGKSRVLQQLWQRSNPKRSEAIQPASSHTSELHCPAHSSIYPSLCTHALARPVALRQDLNPQHVPDRTPSVPHCKRYASSAASRYDTDIRLRLNTSVSSPDACARSPPFPASARPGACEMVSNRDLTTSSVSCSGAGPPLPCSPTSTCCSCCWASAASSPSCFPCCGSLPGPPNSSPLSCARCLGKDGVNMVCCLPLLLPLLAQ